VKTIPFKKLVIPIIIFGIFLRLILSITTYHGDLAALTLSAESISVNHKITDFYESVFTIGEQGELKLPDHQMTFIYQPLAYFIPNIFYFPFVPIIKNVTDGLLHTHPYNIGNKTFYLPLLIFKLPLLAADISLIWLIPLLFKNQKDKNLAKILWALNPLAIYVSSMIGQVDAILTFFLVLGLIYFQRSRFNLSAFFFTLSALVKPIGLITLPFIALFAYQKTNNLKKSLTSLIVGSVTFTLGILPFINSVVYRQYTLFAEHIQKTLFSGIAISPGTLIPLFFITYAILFALSLRRKLNPTMTLGAVLFSSLCFTHFHPQWLVWLTPWLIYLSIKQEDYLIWLITIISWLIILFSFEPSLTLHIFIGFKVSPPNLSTALQNNLTTLVSLSRAWLIALMLLLLTKNDGYKKA
jgi:hypothetical protein